jgi:hypothetical protein
MTRRAPVPSCRTERSGGSVAGVTSRKPAPDAPVDEPDQSDPLQAERGVAATASPEDEAVARQESLGHAGKGLGRLEGEAVDRRAIVTGDPQ